MTAVFTAQGGRKLENGDGQHDFQWLDRSGIHEKIVAPGDRAPRPLILSSRGDRRSGHVDGFLFLICQTRADPDIVFEAMRAIAMIQPPETTAAFVAGLKDSCGDIRRVASAGWMTADLGV